MNIFWDLSSLVLIGLICIRFWYYVEDRKLTKKWREITTHAETAPILFAPAMVANLPSPARRYFLFTIKTGTPLRKIAQIWLSGELALGTQCQPHYQPLKSHQLLALPTGYIWKACISEKMSTLFSSEGFIQGSSWTKFWLFAYLPITRTSADNDHARAIFGRMLAEAACWTPAALLPANGVHWEALNHTHARATCRFKGFTQSIDIHVAEDGRPLDIYFLRWTNANPKKTYQLQPFGGHLSNFESFEGFRLPTQVEAGNFFGSDDYFPLYKTELEGIRFVQNPA